MAALVGLFLGSFINVVALRDNDRKSIIAGRSGCPHCGHTLQWYDLVPLLSFLSVGGKCRYCRKPISWRYPTVELVAAIMVGFIYYWSLFHYESPIAAVTLSLAGLLLLAVSLIDLQSYEVPVEYVIAAGAIGAGGLLFAEGISFHASLLGLIAGAGSLTAVMYGWKLAFKQDGMGSGDLWIAGAIGAMTGPSVIWIALMAAVFAGSIFGITAIALHKKDFAGAIPFGPFLTIGWLVALAWGQSVASWYILGL